MKRNGVLYTLALLSCFITTNTLPVLGDSWHFNTSILQNPEQVRQKLAEDAQKEGYTYNEVTFHPTDNESRNLRGIFLEKPNARATVVFTAGFWPGKKEPFAPFVKLAPKDCNLFFIELTNHGESDDYSVCESTTTCLTPSCFTLPSLNCLQIPRLPNIFGCSICKLLKFIGNLKKYGTKEHFDIRGALEYTAQKTGGKPIVLFGWCAGGFHVIKTIIKLQEMNQQTGQDLLQMYNIQGLIVDSAVTSLTNTIKWLPNYIQKHYLAKTPQSKGFWGKIKSVATSITKDFLRLFLLALESWIKPTLEKNKAETNLHKNIEKLENIPVLAIHCKNDELTKWKDSKKLIDKIQNADLWLIENSSHVKNHLKHKEEYKQRMENWLNKIIKKGPKKQMQKKILEQMIHLVNQIIKLIDSSTDDNPKKQFLNLLQQFATLLNMPNNGLSQDDKDQIAQIFTEIGENPDKIKIKIKLQKVRKILINALNKITNNNNSNDRENQRISICNQMIQLIDKMIKIYKNPTKSNNPQQEIEKLGNQFETLLQSPNSNLSENQKIKIKRELKKVSQAGSLTEIIYILENIKRILKNEKYKPFKIGPTNNTSTNSSTKEKPLEVMPTFNKKNKKQETDQPKTNNLNNKSKSKTGNNSKVPSRPRGSSSRSSSARRSPRSSSSSSSRPYYNNNSSYGNPGRRGGGYNYGGSSSTPTGSWPQRSQKQQQQQSTEIIVTSRDIGCLDEIYGPEMKDQPDYIFERQKRKPTYYYG